MPRPRQRRHVRRSRPEHMTRPAAPKPPEPATTLHAAKLTHTPRLLQHWFIAGCSDPNTPFEIAERFCRPPEHVTPEKPGGWNAWIAHTGERLLAAYGEGSFDITISRPWGNESDKPFHMLNPRKEGMIRFEGWDVLEAAGASYIQDYSPLTEWCIAHDIGMHFYAGVPRCVSPRDERSWIWADDNDSFRPEQADPREQARLLGKLFEASSSTTPVVIMDTANRMQGSDLHQLGDLDDEVWKMFVRTRRQAYLGVETQASLNETSESHKRFAVRDQDMALLGALVQCADTKSWAQGMYYDEDHDHPRAKAKVTQEMCARGNNVAWVLIQNPGWPEDVSNVDLWRADMFTMTIEAGDVACGQLDYVLNAVESGLLGVDFIPGLVKAAKTVTPRQAWTSA